MTSPRRLASALLAAALLAAACGDAGGTATTTAPSSPPPTAPESSTPLGYDPTAELVRADVARSTTTDVTTDELAGLVAADRAFAIDVFHAAAAEGNLIFSPYSISAALTMTLAGARATTADEMTTMLRLQQLEDRVHAARNELDLRINVATPPAEGDERTPFTIRTANSIWGQPGYPFLDAFLELLASEYDAGLRLADFAADPDAARVAINDWVEERTEGRIEDLIPQGAIDPMTRLVLVNAIWFKANWEEQFDPEVTRDFPFTLLDGTHVDVPTMRSTERTLPVAIGDGYLAVSIPYAGDASLLVVMPDAGRFDEIAGELTPESLADVERALTPTYANLKLPRFEMRTELGLNGVLRGLGMVEAFVPPPGPGTADFSGITGSPDDLYVSDVVHQAFITVDEEGTEAAAATAVILRATSAPVDRPIEVTIDRPFVFLIRHDATGEILFMGQVTNPAA